MVFKIIITGSIPVFSVIFMFYNFSYFVLFFLNFNRQADISFLSVEEAKKFIKNSKSTDLIGKGGFLFKYKRLEQILKKPLLLFCWCILDWFSYCSFFFFFQVLQLNLLRLNSYSFSKKKNLNQFFLIGYFDFLKKFKFTFISLFYAFFFLILLIYNQLSSLQKLLAIWFLLGSNVYWLLSTFVFFTKKYYWGKFTTANQRFWKRTLLIFWVIEFFLFSIFLYLTFNANTESYYMLDQLQIYKKFLFSVRLFLLNLSFPTLLVLASYFLLLNLKWQVFNKLTLFFLILSNLIGLILFTECYQFFHLINYYSNLVWEYDIDSDVWLLEFESRKTRTHHHYAILLTIIKFWHIIIIIGVWVFFFLRALELKRFRYPSFSASLQNFFILYIFNWVVLFPWVKVFCKFLAAYTLPQFFLHFRFLWFYFFVSDFICQISLPSFFIFPKLLFFSKYANIYWYGFIF